MLFSPHCIGQEVVAGGKDFGVLEKVKKGNKANPGLKKMSSEDSQRYLETIWPRGKIFKVGISWKCTHCQYSGYFFRDLYIGKTYINANRKKVVKGITKI